MYCPYCGNRLEDGAHFCTNCGAKIDFSESGAYRASEPTSTASHDDFEYDFGDSAPTPPRYDTSSYREPKKDSTGASVGFGILSFFFPLVGFILFGVWNKEYPNRAKSCLIGAVVSVVINIISVIIYFFLLVI